MGKDIQYIVKISAIPEISFRSPRKSLAGLRTLYRTRKSW